MIFGEKYNYATYRIKHPIMAKEYTTRYHVLQNGQLSDDIGLRSPGIQKPFRTETLLPPYRRTNRIAVCSCVGADSQIVSSKRLMNPPEDRDRQGLMLRYIAAAFCFLYFFLNDGAP